MQQILKTFLLAIGVVSIAGIAQACPMCSQSIAEEDLLPHAYMYSIIFMLTMPAVVFTGIGGFIFFQIRKAQSALPADATDESVVAGEMREADRLAPV